VHAIQRMFERGMSVDDVRQVVAGGEIIEEYPEDTPFPSRLVLGRSGGRGFHVVLADNNDAWETIVITVYEPDETRWEPDLRTRRRQ
jgi:hypothetical protein